ncbi:MAG: hypothetical protein FWD73_07615 [Polyangiaceae bacterium]|nr:hypothetical protein [Polyangiaceae bacterium]
MSIRPPKDRARQIMVVVASAVACAFYTLRPLRNAGAQRFDPRYPSSFVVGAPSGFSPVHRVNAQRSGLAKDNLPVGPLHVAWSKNIGSGFDQPALAGDGGQIALVTTSGDVVFLDGNGNEVGRVRGSTRSLAGPAAITSDGTVVFATSAGEAIGVTRHASQPKFLTRIGGERNVHAAPLALDDGGSVVATTTDLVVLDRDGAIRTRVTLPEPPQAPLLVSQSMVVAIAGAGTTYGWTPGQELVRLGTFGAPVDGGAVLLGTNLLLAITDGHELVQLDLVTGARSTRSVASSGLFFGPPCIQPSGRAAMLAMTETNAYAVTIDATGNEIGRATVDTLSWSSTLPDGGPAPLVAMQHTGVLLDRRGVMAFSTPNGRIGSVTPEGVVGTVGGAVCSGHGRSGGVSGLTPFGAAFIVTCESGVVARIDGPVGGAAHDLGVAPR